MIRVAKDAWNSAALAADVLRQGKLAVLPTDTMYGFSAVDTEEGAARICAAKERPEEKAFIRLIADPGGLSRFACVPVPAGLLRLWPGALTLVVPVSGGKTMAFRCPGDAWLRQVVAETGRPVFSTSVNVSGDPPMRRAEEIAAKFGNMLDLLVISDPEETAEILPSTLLDISVRPWRILRQGAVRIPDGLLNS